MDKAVSIAIQPSICVLHSPGFFHSHPNVNSSIVPFAFVCVYVWFGIDLHDADKRRYHSFTFTTVICHSNELNDFRRQITIFFPRDHCSDATQKKGERRKKRPCVTAETVAELCMHSASSSTFGNPPSDHIGSEQIWDANSSPPTTTVATPADQFFSAVRRTSFFIRHFSIVT